ncbi:MAG: hypothetical protein E7560_04275 [Ruminococcaceae bacterium]|nr:hypothetical protein [Oscillospiraceae bacterium]
MKRILSLVLLGAIIMTFTAGCGEKKDRILFADTKFSKYIDLCDYEEITVDTASKEFKSVYDGMISEDIEEKDLYAQKTEGEVAEGDTVNINYSGKKDGVVFAGGTADNQFLTIGSDQFIDGFEDGLIGVAIGDTVDLNLTFPTNYGNEELAGAAVVFTVKVNYVKGGKLTPEEYYSKLGFSTLKEYEADTKERAVKEYIYEKITADSKVKNYPEKDVDKILETVKKAVSLSLQQSYGIDIKTYLGYMNQTEEEFEESLIEDQVKPMMDSQMACYAIFDEAGLKLAEQDVDKKLNEKIAEIGNGVTKEDLIDAYGDFYFEAVVIKEKALDYLYDNVKIS